LSPFHAARRSRKGDTAVSSRRYATRVCTTRPANMAQPRASPPGVCTISVTELPGVSSRRGSLATRIRSYPELIGRAFLSCIDVGYHVFIPGGGETDVTATVLLNAAHPGATPAPLPDMKPLHGHSAIFVAPSSGGEMVARRIPGAWVVAEEAGEDGTNDFYQPPAAHQNTHGSVQSESPTRCPPAWPTKASR
jgi:hypothetical protein